MKSTLIILLTTLFMLVRSYGEGHIQTNQSSEWSKTPLDFESRLIIAIAKRNNEQIAKMINSDDFDYLAYYKPGWIIYSAIMRSNYTVLDALIKKGRPFANTTINTAMDTSGCTALGVAVCLSDKKMVQYLLAHGADAFRINDHYETGIDAAFTQIPTQSKLENIKLVLTSLKKGGMLESFLRWEKMLAEIRARGGSVSDVSREDGCFESIKNAAVQLSK